MRRLEPAIDLALVTAMMMAACTPVEGTATPDGFTEVTHTPVVSTPTEQEQVVVSEFIQLQERIAQSDDFTLLANGTLEMQTEQGIITVAGIKIDPATGTCSFSDGGKRVPCDPDSLVIGEDGSLMVKLIKGQVMSTKDGITWNEVEEVVVAPEVNQLAPETMGCYKADMCLGLKAVDGHARYMELLGAFAGSYENKAWMGGIKTADEFLAFLKTSMHKDPNTGETRPYWVPLERNGAKFTLLQGNGGYARGIFSDENPAIVAAGGFFLDDIAFVAASKAEIDANKGGVADWLAKMWEQNGKNVLIRSGSLNLEQWGVVVVDGQIVFVGINNGIPPESYDPKDRLLGQDDPKKNGQILSALWELYVRVHYKFGNSHSGQAITNGIPEIEPDSNNWYAPSLCVAGTSGFCAGKAPTRFAGENALFVPEE